MCDPATWRTWRGFAARWKGSDFALWATIFTGWWHYYRHGQSSEVFRKLDHFV